MTQPIGVVDGTFAGTDPHAVYRLQLSEIGPPHIPALAELPQIGPHATDLGKIAANIALPMELRTYGWQLQRGDRISSPDQHRAIRHRDTILQAIVDVAQDQDVPEVSVSLPGPVTTSVWGMLPSGQRILRDAGARHDIAAAWADAAEHLVTRIREVIGARTTIIVQEPVAAQAVDGKIRSVSGADLERALDIHEVRGMWQLAAATEATVLIDTSLELSLTAAEVGSVLLPWPSGRSQQTEQTWELVDALVSKETPVGLQVPQHTEPKRFAEHFIQQYLDWGLAPSGLDQLRLVCTFDRASEFVVGTTLESLRTVADHAAGYLTSL